ncbi:universal stress protein [Streptomyces microflavus]|uniref:universal stress protein n=1 Tax=Streptomyces microflavus TaxID=1919 RepID=UPI0037FE1C7D
MSGITVGLDGTDHASAAADWAAEEAKSRRSALRLVHAWLWRPTDVATSETGRPRSAGYVTCSTRPGPAWPGSIRAWTSRPN